MSVDLTVAPWNRLSKLAPPATPPDDLQDAATRHALRADVYAAAADLWEEKALLIDVATEDTPAPGTVIGGINSVSQDGVSVTYATDALAGGGLSARIAARGQMLSNARSLRARAKPGSPLVHDPEYDPWAGRGPWDTDPEAFIVIDEL